MDFPRRDEAVLRDVLARRAEAHPDKVFVTFESGNEWTYAEVAARTWAAAARLIELGVQQGDIVAAWVPNGEAALVAWFAANAAGAVYAPLNTGYRGVLLENALNLTEARVLVAHADLVDRLAQIQLPHVEIVIVVEGTAPSDLSLPHRLLHLDDLTEGRASAPPPLARPVEPWQEMTILPTSGTTGASKAVRRTYVQYTLYTATALRHVGVGASDRFYVCAPMFHGGADVPIFAMLQLGASIAIVESFSASRFWTDIRRFECTITWIHSAMSMFLAKQPPRDDDLDNPLRLAMLAPLFPGFDDFAARHGVHVYTVYGMTEVPCVFSQLDPTDYRLLGRPADPGYEVRLVDENDIEVPLGERGELILRHRLPWAITPGYLNNPAATAATWRNGWFHTGDLFLQTAGGEFSLVGRVKDSIRRRGENVSAVEVETEILNHEAILEAAVIGVPAEIEEDILAFIVYQPEAAVGPEELIAYLADRLPYFALPRYVHVLSSLPLSVAMRVDKPALRSIGLTAEAWDREATGVVVQRERFSRS